MSVNSTEEFWPCFNSKFDQDSYILCIHAWHIHTNCKEENKVKHKSCLIFEDSIKPRVFKRACKHAPTWYGDFTRARGFGLVILDIFLTCVTKSVHRNSLTARECRIAVLTSIDARSSRAHRIWKIITKCVHGHKAVTRWRSNKSNLLTDGVQLEACRVSKKYGNSTKEKVCLVEIHVDDYQEKSTWIGFTTKNQEGPRDPGSESASISGRHFRLI